MNNLLANGLFTLYSHIFNFYRYSKECDTVVILQDISYSKIMSYKYLLFFVHFLVVYLLFKKCLFHYPYYTKNQSIFQQIVQYLMHNFL